MTGHRGIHRGLIALLLCALLAIAGCSSDGALSEPAEPSAVDVDLTQMGSDFVYATVSQMMTDPASFEGKVVRAAGAYAYATTDEPEVYYTAVVIADATACCAQGLEFVWDDGTHAFPDEYPEPGTEVEVTGTFDTYDENGVNYCHLVGSTLEVLPDQQP